MQKYQAKLEDNIKKTLEYLIEKLKYNILTDSCDFKQKS